MRAVFFDQLWLEKVCEKCRNLADNSEKIRDNHFKFGMVIFFGQSGL